MTGREFLEKMLEPIKDKLGPGRYKASTGDIKDSMVDPEEESHDPYEEEDILVELSRKAAAGRVLLLLDGLDEVHGVAKLADIKMPAGHPEKPGVRGAHAGTSTLTPLGTFYALKVHYYTTRCPKLNLFWFRAVCS